MTDAVVVTAAPTQPGRGRVSVLLAGGAVTMAVLLFYAAVSGPDKYLEAGDSPAGLLTGALMLGGTFLGTLSGGLCLGAMVSVFGGGSSRRAERD